MRYAMYDSYSDSGIDWFKQYPSHWNVRRLKWTIDHLKNGVWGAEPDGLNDIVVLRVADFDRTSLKVSEDSLTLRSVDQRERNGRLLSFGDLLIEKSGGGEKQLVGAVVQFTKEFSAITSNFIAAMKPSEGFSSRFLTYLHFHLYASKVNYRSIKQTTGIQNLDSTLYFDEIVALPPLEEQKQIADFLDFKTAKIDALIAKKKELIEKLKEQRIAVITQAVTKGLDTNAAMRYSGVDWLGQVPEHWEIRRLRYCVELVTSGSRGWAKYFSDSGSLFLRITNLNRESISLRLDDVERVDPPDGAEGARTLTQHGDLLISITADLGSVAIIPSKLEPAYVSQHLALVRPETNTLMSEWLALSVFSHSGKSQLLTAGYGGTKIQLNLNDIKEIVFCHPPSQGEQQRILKVTISKTDRIDQLVSVINQAINKLTEYRTALITAATTGKIDVRGVKLDEAE